MDSLQETIKEVVLPKLTHVLIRMRRAKTLAETIDNNMQTIGGNSELSLKWMKNIKELVPMILDMNRFIQNGETTEIQNLVPELLQLDTSLRNTGLAENAYLQSVLQHIKSMSENAWQQEYIALGPQTTIIKELINDYEDLSAAVKALLAQDALPADYGRSTGHWRNSGVVRDLRSSDGKSKSYDAQSSGKDAEHQGRQITEFGLSNLFLNRKLIN